MSDLVKRLRELNAMTLTTGNDYSDVLLDAADEIERLRAGLRELLTNQPYPDHYPYAASVGRCTCRGCEIARRLLGEEK